MYSEHHPWCVVRLNIVERWTRTTPRDKTAMLTEKYAGVEVLAFCAGVSDSQPWIEKITEVQPIILCTTGRQ